MLWRVCVVCCNPTLQAKRLPLDEKQAKMRTGPQPAACVEEVPSGTNEEEKELRRRPNPKVRPKPRRATAWQGRPASKMIVKL